MALRIATIAGITLLLKGGGKALAEISGWSSLEPASAFPVFAAFAWGPLPAGVGSAMGCGLFEILRGPDPLIPFLMAGDFLLGWLPRPLWGALGGGGGITLRFRDLWRLLFLLALVESAAAVVVGWGYDCLERAPFAIIANLTVINRFLVAFVLSPLLLLLPPIPQRLVPLRGRIAPIFLLVGSVGGMIVGNVASWHEIAAASAPSPPIELVAPQAKSTPSLPKGDATRHLLPPFLLLIAFGSVAVMEGRTSSAAQAGAPRKEGERRR
ncbi:MAG: hypothetical protein D6795_03645 [Deltaproteobacteria bacterium]|nr:MAG: hypothetical protein D6795_03645 [Deltaproteobacteria bacterium]